MFSEEGFPLFERTEGSRLLHADLPNTPRQNGKMPLEEILTECIINSARNLRHDEHFAGRMAGMAQCPKIRACKFSVHPV
jgi:hypothetical protein